MSHVADRTRRFIRLVPLAVALSCCNPVAALSAAASDQERSPEMAPDLVPVFAAVPHDSPAGWLGATGSARSSIFKIDESAAQVLRDRGAARVSMALPDVGDRVLRLRRVEMFSDGGVFVNRGRGPVPFRADVQVYRGEIEGDPGSWVVLSVSGEGTFGNVVTANHRFAVSPAPRLRAGSYGAVTDERSIQAPAGPFECGTVAPRVAPPAVPRPAAPSAAAPPTVDASTTRLVCDIAVEGDFQFRNQFSTVTQALAYVGAVYGTISLIYERDLNTTVRVPFVYIWDSPDPYASSTSVLDKFTAFANYWSLHHDDVPRSVAHLLTWSATERKGYSYFVLGTGALCSPWAGYSAIAIYANFRYPTNVTTFDVYAIAHELGHTFGSPHTQSCYWQANGYAATGALLDSCVYAPNSPGDPDPFAPCYTGPTGIVPPDKGTIMSYCHQVLTGGGDDVVAAHVTLKFHPACIRLMRAVAEASCLAPAAVQPPLALTASPSGTGAILSWTASSSPGVLGYSVTRSLIQFDLQAPVVGTPSGTMFSDPLSAACAMQNVHYRVQAVRDGDASDFSNETVFEVCPPAAPAFYPVPGFLPEHAVIGDFNEDGIPDLAVAARHYISPSSSEVLVYLGQGSGGQGNGAFGSPAAYPLGGAPEDIRAGDFNADGITDLAVVGDRFLRILLGSGSGGVGDGTFEPVASYFTIRLPRSLAVGDFNEDGILDIAVAGDAGPGPYPNFAVHVGQGSAGVGNGTFGAATAASLGGSLRSVIVGDFNQDGIQDLAYAVMDSGSVAVRLGLGAAGKGSGSFGPAMQFRVGNGPSSVVTGDFNEDGITDLAVANATSGTVSILAGRGGAGTGDGTFGPPVDYPAGPNPTQLIAADFYEDGILDLVALNDDGLDGGVTYLIGQGAPGVGEGTFVTANRYKLGDSHAVALQAGDLNEDGIPDLVYGTGATGLVAVRLGTCNGSLSNAISVARCRDWVIGTERMIAWTKGTGVSQVNVDLSRDGGANWQTIARDVTGESLVFTVTEPPTPRGRVRVYDPYVPMHSGTNSTTFGIYYDEVGVKPAGLTDLDAIEVENPVRGDVVVSFAVPRPERIRLELFGLSGRRVAEREIEAERAGAQVVRLAGKDEVPPGVYFLRIRDAARSVTRKLVVLH